MSENSSEGDDRGAADSSSVEPSASSEQVTRRSFVLSTTAIAMGGGLVAGYGTFFVMAGRFLYPSRTEATGWQFLATVDQLKLGDSFTYVSPSGATVVVARQSEGDTAEDFIALSSVCPHLGCQVHWESQNDRFFCPCHNGAFDRQGEPTEGPPLSANQSLTRFPLKVQDGLLFIEAPLDSVTSGERESAQARPQSRGTYA